MRTSLMLLILGAAPNAVPEAPVGDYKFGRLLITTDPPGGHMYGEDGKYWGQATAEKPIEMVWKSWSNGENPKWTGTFTFKKQGHEPSVERITIWADQSTEEEAKRKPQRYAVVLN